MSLFLSLVSPVAMVAFGWWVFSPPSKRRIAARGGPQGTNSGVHASSAPAWLAPDGGGGGGGCDAPCLGGGGEG